MSEESQQAPAGRHASKPREIPKLGWIQIAKRVGDQIKVDFVPIVSAGVAFYFFLALFPLLAALLSTYGLFVTPAEAEAQIEEISAFLPEKVHELISQFGETLTGNSDDALGWGVILSILISLWSANKGAKALVTGLNIVYDETESRGFFKKTATTLFITLLGFASGVVMLGLVALFPALSAWLPIPDWSISMINWFRWPILALLVIVLLAFIYKIAPSRDRPEFKWTTWGAVIATLLWLGGSALFSLYVDNFGSYAKTYGSLASVVILMLWFYLTVFIILLGAEINSEMEHQTAIDTTVGRDKPLGQRGAFHADHVAGEHSEKNYTNGKPTEGGEETA